MAASVLCATFILYVFLIPLPCREEAEAKAKKERYMQLTAEGKTDQAKADLARLAKIRKEREDAEKRRQQESKGSL